MQDKKAMSQATRFHFIETDIIEAVKSFPLTIQVSHCGIEFTVDSLDVYCLCPKCKSKIKLRSFSGFCEIEDVFDAVFE